MAARTNPRLSDAWRQKIRTSMLVNRLQQNAAGKIELTQGQIKSIEILLRKTLPDLSHTEAEISGGLAITINDAWARNNAA